MQHRMTVCHGHWVCPCGAAWIDYGDHYAAAARLEHESAPPMSQAEMVAAARAALARTLRSASGPTRQDRVAAADAALALALEEHHGRCVE